MGTWNGRKKNQFIVSPWTNQSFGACVFFFSFFLFQWVIHKSKDQPGPVLGDPDEAPFSSNLMFFGVDCSCVHLILHRWRVLAAFLEQWWKLKWHHFEVLLRSLRAVMSSSFNWNADNNPLTHRGLSAPGRMISKVTDLRYIDIEPFAQRYPRRPPYWQVSWIICGVLAVQCGEQRGAI